MATVVPMRLSHLPLAAAALLATVPASAEEPPMRSVPLVAVGGTLTGLGVANLATAPLCTTSGIQHHTSCLALSLAFGGGLIAAGVPMIVVGAQRVPPVMVTPTVGGAVVTWRSSW